MLFFISLIPATLFITVGYFVLFSSTRAERGVKQFGNLLAVWMFILGGAVVAGGLLAPAMGFRGPMGFAQHMQQMQEVQEELLQELQKD